MTETGELLNGLRLPDGWRWDDEMTGQTRSAWIEWPQHGLTMIISHPNRAMRETLHNRFQLFDSSNGGFKALANDEEYHVILRAFDEARARR